MALVARHYREDRGFDQSAAGKVTGPRKEVTVKYKKPDMEERFERWIYKNNKKYRDEEEKAMRFQRFKATVEWIDSQPLDVQEGYFPEISYFADNTEEENRFMLARPHGFDRYNTEEEEMVKAVLAKQRGRRLGMKQGDTRAAQVSA
jgi:esterase/lipase superfamily enzyme